MGKQLNLVIDRGNTRIKAGIFNQQELLWTDVFENSASLIETILTGPYAESLQANAILSDTSSGEFPESIAKTKIQSLKSYKSLPIEIDYESPKTLGDDRIANACAIAHLYPNDAVLIIDAGTCITFDLVLKMKFIGGAISPGIRMRYRALHEYTGKLPLVNDGYRDVIIGKNTIDNLHSGALHGAIIEAQKRIEDCQEQFPDLKVFLTGGDLNYFEMALKSLIFADANLTLLGLNEILRYNNV
jgi:type III pantothenate kinase